MTSTALSIGSPSASIASPMLSTLIWVNTQWSTSETATPMRSARRRATALHASQLNSRGNFSRNWSRCSCASTRSSEAGAAAPPT